ncbi:hypothetical protein [Tahibacter aquaticus]|uniref:hypothetical protein n=1 Tax=Tahibacter aquaticus TaxID=520092 RepID=UPI00105F79E3|nr:hypothetical protein [Tahibacter aquaticus]
MTSKNIFTRLQGRGHTRGRQDTGAGSACVPAQHPPVKGRFEHGLGSFYSDGEIGGKAVRTRFVWSPITPVSARWEQAYSVDAGKNCQTNWIMQFRREPAE